MCDALVRISGLRGAADEPSAASVAASVLGMIEEVRLRAQELNERRTRREERDSGGPRSV